jgi:hypothetical protein
VCVKADEISLVKTKLLGRIINVDGDKLSIIFDDTLGIWDGQYDRFSAELESEPLDPIDKYYEPRYSHSLVYAVPRIKQGATSSLYLNYIDLFGNAGCFSLIITLLANSTLPLETLLILSQYITLPHVYLHEAFIEENGVEFVELVR